jgi:hypothetical protein
MHPLLPACTVIRVLGSQAVVGSPFCQICGLQEFLYCRVILVQYSSNAWDKDPLFSSLVHQGLLKCQFP